MKRVLLICIICALAGCSSPELSFTDGSKVAVSSYQGKWLLINYWAVWCKPCVEEIPELNLVNAKPNLQVVGVNFDKESGATLAQQSEKLGIQFPLLSEDPSTIFEQSLPKALPATMVVGPDGRFRGWLMGPQTDATIAQYLASSE